MLLHRDGGRSHGQRCAIRTLFICTRVLNRPRPGIGNSESGPTEAGDTQVHEQSLGHSLLCLDGLLKEHNMVCVLWITSVSFDQLYDTTNPPLGQSPQNPLRIRVDLQYNDG
jgi:hypothetical protein